MTITSDALPTWEFPTHTNTASADGSTDDPPTETEGPDPDPHTKTRTVPSSLPSGWRPLDDDVREWGNV